MNHRIALTLATVLAASIFTASATAQERPTLTAQTNTIFVGADGKYEANPDTAQIQFNISAQENTSKDAYDHASRSAEQIRGILRSNGVEPKHAQIGFFSLQPVYDYKNPSKRKLIGRARSHLIGWPRSLTLMRASLSIHSRTICRHRVSSASSNLALAPFSFAASSRA